MLVPTLYVSTGLCSDLGSSVNVYKPFALISSFVLFPVFGARSPISQRHDQLCKALRVGGLQPSPRPIDSPATRKEKPLVAFSKNSNSPSANSHSVNTPLVPQLGPTSAGKPAENEVPGTWAAPSMPRPPPCCLWFLRGWRRARRERRRPGSLPRLVGL